MKKFSKIIENINIQKHYEISSELKFIVKAENEGEAGYIADSTLGKIEEQTDFSIINISEISQEEYQKYFENNIQDEEETDHRDVNGKWVPEPCVAKLRNRLSSFWTLSTMLNDNDMWDKVLNDPHIQKMLLDLAKTCEDNKPIIQKYLTELSNIEDISLKNKTTP